ncbi:MAG: asparagine synthase (glutamine-hydrolyzing) [Rhodothermales bacterium]|nr:asparagine synthase (glutamine-hydrolyzing) [Rhodothermales bacterium]
MCGIIGQVGYDGLPDTEGFEAARDLMTHRGPDDAGIDRIGPACFAFRRLSIIDLSADGHQPMMSTDGSVMLLFNGEIYNYVELRQRLVARRQFRSHTDSEVILNGYLEWGWEKMLSLINGMFGIAIWDNNTGMFYAARDRVGKKPFFFRRTADGLAFSSTLNAVVALSPDKPEVDASALDAYLVYQAVPSPETIFKGYDQLAPAHQITFDWNNNSFETSRYWDVDYSNKIVRSEKQILDDMDTLIRTAVRERLMSDVPLGAFLSGGVDSSLVVSLMAQEDTSPVEAVIMGFEDPAFDERPYARQVAEKWGVRLHEHVLEPNAIEDLPQIVWHYGQPVADVSIVPTYYVAQAAREHVTVVLNGDGGDEVFGGYARPVVARAAQNYRRVFPAVARRAIAQTFKGVKSGPLKKLAMLAAAGGGSAEESFVYDRAFRPFRDSGYSDQLIAQLNGNPDRFYRDVWRSAAATDDTDRALYGDLTTYLPDQLLAKMDVSTMAHSLEARAPLLDMRLIEYAATIPTKQRIKQYRTKHLLKKLAERYVPREVLYRRKKGFVMPAADWLRGELSPFLKATVGSSPFLDRGWIDPDFTRMMIDEHLSAKTNWGEQLWTLFVLELWARMMIDGTLGPADSLEGLLQ